MVLRKMSSHPIQFPDMSNIDEDIVLKPGSNEIRQVLIVCFRQNLDFNGFWQYLD